MITDEMILKIHQDTAKHGGIVEFARELIALAQEVRPLMITHLKDKQDGTIGRADTCFGRYWFFRFDSGYMVELSGVCIKDKLTCYEFAQEAAQADFNRRVLENLVHGGVE